MSRRVLAVVLVTAAAVGSEAPVLVREVVWDGPAHREDKCTGMVLRPDGSVCLAGYSMDKVTDFDFAVIGIDTAGEIAWEQHYGAPLGCEDRPWCLALDSTGAAIAAGGSIADFDYGWDFLLVKYLENGDTAWLRRLDFPAHSDDKPAGIAVGPGDDVFVTGRSRARPDSGSRSHWDIATVRYSVDGDTVWTRTFDGPVHGDDQGTAIAVDVHGNSYIAGKATLNPPGTDIVLLKYGPGGEPLWQRALRSEGPGSNLAQAVLLDSTGRCYLLGALYNRGSSFDYATACFSAEGEQVWLRTHDGASSVDIPQAACFDSAGNIVVTGQSTGRGSSFDILTVCYSVQGDTLWTRRYDGPQNSADRGWCITPGPEGGVIVGGSSVGPNGYPDLVLVCYSDDGEELWTYRFSGGGTGETRPVALSWDRRPGETARLLVGGFVKRPGGTGFDYLLLQLESGN